MAFNPIPLTANSQTGNNTHTAVDVNVDIPVAFEFVVEAIGATPTVSYTIQGSFDNSNFYPLNYITDATDTPAVTARTATTVSRQVLWPSWGTVRTYRYYRVVTTANTNVTYRAVVWVSDV